MVLTDMNQDVHSRVESPLACLGVLYKYSNPSFERHTVAFLSLMVPIKHDIVREDNVLEQNSHQLRQDLLSSYVR